MAPLALQIIFVLLFEGISADSIMIYKTPGQDATLSCGGLTSIDSSCCIATWFYHKERSVAFAVVQNGGVVQKTSRSARLSLNSDCSLVINNIVVEDAGAYTCRTASGQDNSVYLNVLSVSSFSADADPTGDGEVILECCLWRYRELQPCEKKSVCWVDEKGVILLDENAEYKFLGQTNCDSYVKVKHQSGNNRRFTCLVLNQNILAIKAEYTPVSLGIEEEDHTEKSQSVSTNQPLSAIMWTLRVTGLILMIGTTVLLIRDKGFRKLADKNKVPLAGNEVTYENAEAGPAAMTRH